MMNTYVSAMRGLHSYSMKSAYLLRALYPHHPQALLRTSVCMRLPVDMAP